MNYKLNKFINKFLFKKNNICICPKGVEGEIHYEKEKICLSFNKDICIKCKESKECIKYGIFLDKTMNFEFNSQILAEKYYNYGLELMDRNQTAAAKAMFEFISSYNNFYTGGAYVNIAEIEIREIIYKYIKETKCNSIEKIEFELSDVYRKNKYIETCYLQALGIKCNNQVALSGIAIYYYVCQEYSKSLIYAQKINTKEALERYIEYILVPIDGIDIRRFRGELKGTNIEERLRFYNEIKDRIDLNSTQLFCIKMIIIEYSIENEDYLDAILEYKKIINDIGERDEINEQIANIYFMNLADYNNAFKYYEKILNPTHIIKGQCAACLMGMKEYKKAEILLEELMIDNPNNTNYTNLAATKFKLKKYNQAEENLLIAMAIFEDETEYELMAEIKFAKDEITEGIKYLKKKIYFLETQNMTFSKNDCNGEMVISSYLGDKNKSLFESRKKIIKILLESERYEEAYVINNEYLELGEEWFITQQKILGKLISINKLNSTIEKLKLEREKLQQVNTKSRNWVLELIKYKTSVENLNDLEKLEWIEFEKVINKSLKKIESSSNNDELKKEISKNNRNMFTGIEKKSLECLNTAEYLYQITQQNTMDFSPIAIGFSKVFEIELNRIFKTSNYTLGELLNSDRISLLDEYLIHCLHDIRKIRNLSAHTNVLKKDKVEEIRRKIFDEKILEELVKYKSM